MPQHQNLKTRNITTINNMTATSCFTSKQDFVNYIKKGT